MEPEGWINHLYTLENKDNMRRKKYIILKANPSARKKADINNDSERYGIIGLVTSNKRKFITRENNPYYSDVDK